MTRPILKQSRWTGFKSEEEAYLMHDCMLPFLTVFHNLGYLCTKSLCKDLCFYLKCVQSAPGFTQVHTLFSRIQIFPSFTHDTCKPGNWVLKALQISHLLRNKAVLSDPMRSGRGFNCNLSYLFFKTVLLFFTENCFNIFARQYTRCSVPFKRFSF